jgi:hypothetical protein
MRTNRPGWFLWTRAMVLTLSALWLFWEESNPGGGSFSTAGLLIFGAWFLLGTAYLCHLLWVVGSFRSREDRPPLLSPPMAVWLVEPFIFLLVIACLARNLPMRVRFTFSEPALTSYVQAVQKGGNSSSRVPLKVGSYTIYETHRLQNGEVRLITGPCGLFDDCGFIYSPQRRPQAGGENWFQPLRPRWYVWHRSW